MSEGRRIILFSKRDPASLLVKETLLENFGFKETEDVVFGNRVIRRGELLGVTTKKDHLYLSDDELRSLDASLIVVASRHRSESGVNALLTHSTGNWTERADYGGLPMEVSYTMAGAVRTALMTLLAEHSKHAKLSGWQVGLEATHHGPFSTTPLIYVEFGGGSEALRDVEAAEVVASACIEAARASKAERAYVGIGGSHYAPKFTELSIEEGLAFGHVVASYAMPLDVRVLRQAFERTVEERRTAIIDWKGLKGEHRKAVIEALDSMGIEYVRA